MASSGIPKSWANFGAVPVIENRGREYKGAADGEIGEVADKIGRRALEQKLEQHFDELADHAGDRPEVERADHDRDLAQIHFVERRRTEKRDLQQHQDARDGGKNGDEADRVRGAQTAAFAAEALSQRSDPGKRRRDQQADQQKGKIFTDALEQFGHIDHLIKIAPEADFRRTNARRRRRNFRLRTSSSIQTVKRRAASAARDSDCRYRIFTGSAFARGLRRRCACITAGREFHPALKRPYSVAHIIHIRRLLVNRHFFWYNTA